MNSGPIPDSTRAEVYERAQGKCEYCLLPEIGLTYALEVDHIIPRKQGGGNESKNLALCCKVCNTFKGPSVVSYVGPVKRFIRLYDPRTDLWEDHFQLLPNGYIKPTSGIGEGTVKILRLNIPLRVEGRYGWILAGMM